MPDDTVRLLSIASIVALVFAAVSVRRRIREAQAAEMLYQQHRRAALAAVVAGKR